MKTNITILLTITLFAVLSCKQTKKDDPKVVQQPKKENVVKMDTTQAFNPAELSDEPSFDIITTFGAIRVKLYKETPLHRDNFVKLAAAGYYDSLLFHRVINGFMIQTGDPLTKDTANHAKFGTGGPGYTIPAEILPQFKHKKGALAAARTGNKANPEKASSGSQFYIVQDAANCAHLNGEYTVFGEVVSGIQVVDLIASTPTNLRDLPLTEIRIMRVVPVIVPPSGKPAAH